MGTGGLWTSTGSNWKSSGVVRLISMFSFAFLFSFLSFLERPAFPSFEPVSASVRDTKEENAGLSDESRSGCAASSWAVAASWVEPCCGLASPVAPSTPRNRFLSAESYLMFFGAFLLAFVLLNRVLVALKGRRWCVVGWLRAAQKQHIEGLRHGAA